MQKKERQKKDDKTQQQKAKFNEAEPDRPMDVSGDHAEEPSDGPGDTDALAEQLESTREEIRSLQSQLEEANDKFLRLFSEFDNYRKRVTRERIELTKTAAEGVITALLPVLDDLERASATAARKGGGEAGEEGIVLIYNKFKSVLKQKGVEEIPSVGEEFDTDYHEAITHMPAESEKEKGKIKEEVQKGYLLNGKVIRYARVVVAN